MTGPVTTEALVEGKPTRRTLIQAQARRHYEHVCSLHEMIRSLEAALQQVTAERDAKTDVLAEMKLCAEATADERERLLSELARLRAEGEAKDRALKPFADAADAYPVSDVARREARRQEEVIWSYGCEDKGNRREITVADIRAARAAAAREGQIDA